MRSLFIRGRLLRYVRRLKKLITFVIYTALFLLIAFFIPPARNLIGYFVLPGAWRELSSFRILHLYFADPYIPVEATPVTCDSVQERMKNVQWRQIVSELNSFNVYGDKYFQDLKMNRARYGTSEKDLKVFNERYPRFKPSMTELWQRQMQLTFKMYVHAMEVFNMTFFLSEGSMLGSYRHHGFIPWDDDMDICMNGSDWLRVKQILHCIPDFDVHVEDNLMYKFFWNKAPYWKGTDDIRYPFIDIFFFNEDNEYIWAMTQFKKNRIVFKKSDIFPLTYRPYEGLIVPVPGQIDKICTTVYDPSTCVSRDFDHLNRHFLPFYEVEYIPCETFYRIYPFVVRKKEIRNGKKVTVEYRKVGQYIMSEFAIP